MKGWCTLEVDIKCSHVRVLYNSKKKIAQRACHTTAHICLNDDNQRIRVSIRANWTRATSVEMWTIRDVMFSRWTIADLAVSTWHYFSFSVVDYNNGWECCAGIFLKLGDRKWSWAYNNSEWNRNYYGQVMFRPFCFCPCLCWQWLLFPLALIELWLICCPGGYITERSIGATRYHHMEHKHIWCLRASQQ